MKQRTSKVIVTLVVCFGLINADNIVKDAMEGGGRYLKSSASSVLVAPASSVAPPK